MPPFDRCGHKLGPQIIAPKTSVISKNTQLFPRMQLLRYPNFMNELVALKAKKAQFPEIDLHCGLAARPIHKSTPSSGGIPLSRRSKGEIQ